MRTETSIISNNVDQGVGRSELRILNWCSSMNLAMIWMWSIKSLAKIWSVKPGIMQRWKGVWKNTQPDLPIPGVSWKLNCWNVIYQVKQFSNNFVIKWKEFQASWASMMEKNRAEKKKKRRNFKVVTTFKLLSFVSIRLCWTHKMEPVKTGQRNINLLLLEGKDPKDPKFSVLSVLPNFPETEAKSRTPSCQNYLGNKSL